MNFLYNFKFQLNKDKVISSVQSYCQTPPYEELDKMYDNLLPLLRECSKPVGIFKIDEKPKNLKLEILENCRYIVHCAVTIGQEPVNKVDSLFNEGKFFQAILLDTMASSYLFNISSQLFHKICEKSHYINLGLTRKIAPGDGEIELEYQQKIINKLNNNELYDIRIVNKGMLYPSKSMSYIYGADESLLFNQQKDHCCENCYNLLCSMREVSSSPEKSYMKNTDCA